MIESFDQSLAHELSCVKAKPNKPNNWSFMVQCSFWRRRSASRSHTLPYTYKYRFTQSRRIFRSSAILSRLICLLLFLHFIFLPFPILLFRCCRIAQSQWRPEVIVLYNFQMWSFLINDEKIVWNEMYRFECSRKHCYWFVAASVTSGPYCRSVFGEVAIFLMIRSELLNCYYRNLLSPELKPY